MVNISIADMPYHFGIKLNAHPTKKQKDIIFRNSNASRFVYNKLIGIDQEMFNIKKVDLLQSRHHKDYYKLVNYLMNHYNINEYNAKYMIRNKWVSKKTINKAKAKNYDKYNKFQSTGIPMLDEHYNQLKERKKSGKTLGGQYRWLYHKDIDSTGVSQAFQANKKAWNMYNKVHNAGTPKFHKKSYEDNYQTAVQYSAKVKKNDYPNMVNGIIKFIDKHHIKLPKLGVVYITHMREFIWQNRESIRMGTVTIHKDNTGVYTVSIQLGSEKPFVKIPEKTGAVVGIDLNTDNFYSDSNGNVIPNPRYYKRSLVRLKKQQRILSRRILRAKKENRSIRESKNVQKQRIKVAMISKRVYNQRNSFLDKASKTLIENQDLVVAEELRTKNMLKNHALAQAISDVGWRLMLQKLAYKSELYGKTFVTINPNNTSRICSSCGQKNHEFDDLTQNEWLATREWTCPTCHQYHDRDVNAAKNILSKGLEELAK